MISADPRLPQLTPTEEGGGVLVGFLRRFQERFYSLWRELAFEFGKLPKYEESTTTPTVTASVGAFTTVAATVYATKHGDRVSFNVTVTITTNNTAAGYIIVPLPYDPAEDGGCGGILTSTQTALAVHIDSSSTGNLWIYKYDGTYPGADGYVLRCSGNYRVT